MRESRDTEICENKKKEIAGGRIRKIDRAHFRSNKATRRSTVGLQKGRIPLCRERSMSNNLIKTVNFSRLDN